jgi:hypothetical protein
MSRRLVEEVPDRYRRFADAEAAGVSSLYEDVARRISADPQVLALIEVGASAGLCL